MTVIDHDFSRYFSDVPGCAVVYDQEADRYEVYDRRKAFQRVSPCSTYKIYSGLNALEEGLISVAAPLINAQGQTVGAINVSGQVNRTNAQEMESRILPHLLSTAQSVSQLLRTTRQ